MTEDSEEWKRLSTDQKCQHKLWRARAEGYKECVEKFPLWDGTSPNFVIYAGLMKKFVMDPNELVRILGVEAALLFVEHAEIAMKTCGEVVSGIIQKCFGTKQRLKDVAIDVCLMYIEINRNDQAVEVLVKGFQNRQPKVATACLETVTKALSLFGSKVIQLKAVVKQIPALTDHRDKKVREAAKALSLEMYRWMGMAIKLSLQNISSVLLKELEDEWEKADASGKPKRTRFMRSEKDLKKNEFQGGVSSGGSDDDFQDAQNQAEAEAYDQLQPVEILSHLPKKFYVLIEANKWQERKKMLEACLTLCNEPKIEPSDIVELVKALRKVVAKDANVMLVSIAAKCLAGLARGLRKKFQPFATSCMDVILEKCKEKKPMVVAALQEAADAICCNTSIQALCETFKDYLGKKNPSIKERTALLLTEAISKTKHSAWNKAAAKPFVQSLLKNIDHGSPTVRDATFSALGVLLKQCGEKTIMPFLNGVDAIKLGKIKEYAGKGGRSKSATKICEFAKAPAKAPSSPSVGLGDGKKKVTKSAGKNILPKSETDLVMPQEPYLSDSAVEEQLVDFLHAEMIAKLSSSIWKERWEALQSLLRKLKLSDIQAIPCQALVKTLGSGRQGWKDSNVHCLNEKFCIVQNLATHASFSKTSAEICIPGLIEKIGDVKCGKASKEAMTAIAEAIGFSWVSEKLLEIAIVHKNPKVQSESLSWISNAMKEFGTAGANVKLIIAKLKVGFVALSPTVRTAAFEVFGTMALFIGPKIRMFFQGEKPAVLQQIDAEIEKCKGQILPAPIRGKNAEASALTKISFEDLVPRVNISNKVTHVLIAKLSDKNWKVRRVALDQVIAILDEANFVQPDIGELATAITERLSDSNKILIITSLAILSQLSKTLGPHCKEHIKTVAPGMINVLADSKPHVREASLKAMDLWLENTDLSMWFEHEIMSNALSEPKHIFLRVELLNWLLEKLLATPKVTPSAKVGLEACGRHVYACCEDRSAEVRTNAQAILPVFIYHLGMDKMVRLCGKLSATSLSMMMGLLEEAKERAPACKSKTSLLPNSAAVPAPIDLKIDGFSSCKYPNGEGKLKCDSKSKSSKKEVVKLDSGPALIKIQGGKEQRARDEQKLKNLKWAFDVPRNEFVMQLKTLLNPCVGPDLAAELFHADFQHHIKALTILNGALETQWEETIATLDLLLRWITLRFYEKNTTVHMKCFEFLVNLFKKLSNREYRMSDYEAGGFIPHLIIKIGEPKENIRKDVRAVMQQITMVYPAGKVFSHLLHGLLTKNCRQKTECMDQMGYLITCFGIDVCQPTASKALREIASHIGDRDNAVRSSALNVVVCAYNVCGSAIYQHVGNLNEKDKSMLEERIKRSGKVESTVPEIKGVQLLNKTDSVEKSKTPAIDVRPCEMVARQSTKRLDVQDSKYKTPERISTDKAASETKHIKLSSQIQNVRKSKASANDICSSKAASERKAKQLGTRVLGYNKQELPSANRTVRREDVKVCNNSTTPKKSKSSLSSSRSSGTLEKQNLKRPALEYSNREFLPADVTVPERKELKSQTKVGTAKKSSEVSLSYICSFEHIEKQKSKLTETLPSECNVQEPPPHTTTAHEDEEARLQIKSGTGKTSKIPTLTSVIRSCKTVKKTEINKAEHRETVVSEYYVEELVYSEMAVPGEEEVKSQSGPAATKKPKISASYICSADAAKTQNTGHGILVSEVNAENIAREDEPTESRSEVDAFEKADISAISTRFSDVAEAEKSKRYTTRVVHVQEVVPEREAVMSQSKIGTGKVLGISTSYICSSNAVETQGREQPETPASDNDMQEILRFDMKRPETVTSNICSPKRLEELGRFNIRAASTAVPNLLSNGVLDEPDTLYGSSVDRPTECRNPVFNVDIDETLDTLIATLTTIDIDECLKCVHLMDDILKSGQVQLFKPKVDQILSSSCVQIRLLINRCTACISSEAADFDGGDANNKVLKIQSLCKCLFAVDLTLATTADLALCASQSVLQDFIHVVSMFMLDKRVKETLPNAERLNQVLNLLVANLFDHANPTYVMCAVLREVKLSLETPAAKFTELSLRCLWKIIPMIQDFLTPLKGSPRPSLETALVLAEIHRLYAALHAVASPSRKDQINVIVRTTRALIFKFCDILGMGILDEVRDIEGVESSEVLRVVAKALKSRYPVDKVEAHSLLKTVAESGGKNRENADVANDETGIDRKLALIMKKVGYYELTKRGLQELYDFRKEYPDYDVESKFADPSFTSYIKRSLQRIDEERSNGITSSSNTAAPLGTIETSKQQLEHIKMLRKRCGLPAESAFLANVENKVHLLSTKSDKNASDLEVLYSAKTKSIGSQSASAEAAESPGSSVLPQRPVATSTMDNLKRRLEKIKREAKQRN